MANTDSPDNELIKAYLHGDSSGFDVLYERYKRQLYSYLSRLLGDDGMECDDIFQQTWLRIIGKMPEYQCRQRFLAWAMRIAHNLVMDHFRRNSRRNVEVVDMRDYNFSSDKEPWHDMDRSELSVVIGRAIKDLPPELREVFLLRLEQISFREIAEIQGCSINTALSRMQYALKNLQRMMISTEYGGDRTK